MTRVDQNTEPESRVGEREQEEKKEEEDGVKERRREGKGERGEGEKGKERRRVRWSIYLIVGSNSESTTKYIVINTIREKERERVSEIEKERVIERVTH